ncbi:MAG: hypothetical protein ACQESW_13535 [Bacteroidota bacterium]
MVLSVLEIAIFLMLPLILFYQRSVWPAKKYIPLLVVLYLIWYVTYALMHELSHLLGVLIMGKDLQGYQLLPRFWQGEFGYGVVHYNFVGDRADFWIILMPYLRDVLLCIIGFLLVKRRIASSAFVVGLILVLLVFSPLYDVANNYGVYLLYSINDFNALSVASSRLTAHVIGVSFFLITLFLSVRVLQLGNGYPQKV